MQFAARAIHCHHVENLFLVCVRERYRMAETGCGSGGCAPSARPRRGHAKNDALRRVLLVWTAPDGIKRARMRSL